MCTFDGPRATFREKSTQGEWAGGGAERSDCWRRVKAPSEGPPPPPHTCTSFSPNCPFSPVGAAGSQAQNPKMASLLLPEPFTSTPSFLVPLLHSLASGKIPETRCSGIPSPAISPGLPPPTHPPPALSPPPASHHPDPQPPGICPGRWRSIAWLALLEALTSSLNSLSPGWLFLP